MLFWWALKALHSDTVCVRMCVLCATSLERPVLSDALFALFYSQSPPLLQVVSG